MAVFYFSNTYSDNSSAQSRFTTECTDFLNDEELCALRDLCGESFKWSRRLIWVKTMNTHQGTVYKKTIGHYFVHTDGMTVVCEISPRLRKQLVYPTADPSSLRHNVREVAGIQTTDPVAVGDLVSFIDGQNGPGLIVEVLPRRNKLVRLDPGRKRLEQVIVANLDQVVPVFAAAQPAPKWNMLDRYLVSAESLGLSSLICITKLDLAGEDPELTAEIAAYSKSGYRVILTSAVTKQGMDSLREALKGRVSVFVGKSGVGKTSLLNTLQPGLGLRVNEVSQLTSKGKHTTTNLTMFSLDFGGSVIDTPGMREFGLWESDEDNLAQLFPEMRPFLGQCKFGLDCSHDSEPGCAIRAAVEEGKIHERRYNSYLKLVGEV